MATSVLNNRAFAIPVRGISRTVAAQRYNPYALASFLFVVLFVSYFLVPHIGMARVMFRLSMFYVIVFPLAAFILAAMAVRRSQQPGNGGRFMSYFSLAVSGLYLIVALAIPVVLIGCYVLYSYIL